MFLRICFLLIVGTVILVAALTSFYIVDRAEYVYVTQFGRHVATHDGETDAGLHWKLPWPIQSVQRLDLRLQVFDLPETELPTHDPRGKTIDKMLTIDAYVCWKIDNRDSVDRFIRTVGTPERAREILSQRVQSRLGATIPTLPLEEIIRVSDGTDSGERLDRLSKQLLGIDGRQVMLSALGVAADGPLSLVPLLAVAEQDSLKNIARQEYGIEIVDVRLRRFNHPPGVRQAIFDRIRSEREKKVAEYRGEANKRATEITSAAEREAKDLLTDAQSRQQRLQKEADIQADEMRNQAHAKDPEFYTFLQKLETYQKILDKSKDVLLLSSKHEIFDLLLNPPNANQRGTPSTSPPITATPRVTSGEDQP
ncbi:MAG: protease modulator HflC [Gemmataceae bacterium]